MNAPAPQLMDYMEARAMLDRYGLRSVDSKYVVSAAEAVKFASKDRIVLKVLSNKALHKSKSGLVKLDLSTEKEIIRAFNDLVKRAANIKPYKIIAQRMSPAGVEIIIGGKTDPQFGKTILIGLGGIYVEAFRDFALRLVPITRYDTQDMLAQLKSSSIITYSGEHQRMLESLLLSVSRMLEEHAEIAELDLNPVIVTKAGYEIVDIRVLR